MQHRQFDLGFLVEKKLARGCFLIDEESESRGISLQWVNGNWVRHFTSDDGRTYQRTSTSMLPSGEVSVQFGEIETDPVALSSLRLVMHQYKVALKILLTTKLMRGAEQQIRVKYPAMNSPIVCLR